MRVPSVGGDSHLCQLTSSVLNLIPLPLLLTRVRQAVTQAVPLTCHFWDFRPGHEGLRED